MPVENILPRVWYLIKWNPWNGWSWFWTDGESTLWLRHFEEASNFRSNNSWQDFQECPGKDSTMWLITGYFFFQSALQQISIIYPKRCPSAYIVYILAIMAFHISCFSICCENAQYDWLTFFKNLQYYYIVHIQNKISDQDKKNLVGNNFKMAVSGMFEMKLHFFSL